MKLELFHFPTACSQVPFILLYEADAEFSVHYVDLRSEQQATHAFRQINPKGKVPVLLVDGKPLTENLAIQFWIARQFKAAKLFPESLFEQSEVLSLMTWCASALHPSITPNVRPQRYCDLPGTEDAVRRCAQALLHSNFEVAEQRLTGNTFFFDEFTAADAYFYWVYRRAVQVGFAASLYPNCAAHQSRMLGRTSVQRSLNWELEVNTIGSDALLPTVFGRR
ncbi:MULTISPECIES: glutathione S-transferase family protein [Burkholderia cepacia complex]|uniref:glutathione S-transferase family protein n=1 Tax=Burkholderia cepacia complex TaxID=87882 RepID=UPI0026E04C19|nr:MULTISPECIES: glutathione S-transferase family protein [Burkholderia cepacia complex]MDO5948171.1 glutathione S-transferase family protein [Burkholderia cepacia]MDS0803610.1 glutathione S-transferase family protein [Burkholderia cenocepacia]